MNSSDPIIERRNSILNWALLLAVWMVFWGVSGLGGRAVKAQVGSSSADALTSRDRPVQISIQPTYQRFEDEDQTLTQLSVPVVAVVPFKDRWQLSFRGSGASTSGDDLQTVSGLTDVRVALSYARSIGDGSLIFNASVNAPVGKEDLTRDEFNTARLLSRNFYRFRVASFGQGFGGGTGVTWAIPVTESIVVGIGGSFRYRGSYSPAVDRQEEYDPGEEGRLTGGVDIQLDQYSALSTDVSFFTYGTDTVGSVDQFEVGNQFSVRMQYLRETDQTLRIVGYYREQEKSVLPLRSDANRELQVLPSQAKIQGRYTFGLAESVDLRMSAAGRWYDETTGFESKTLLTFGLSPQIAVGERLSISPRVAYTTGSLTGLEGGLGLGAQF